MIGDIHIPGYSISTLLHEGAHTLVYRAVKNDDVQKVILKTLANPYPSLSQIAELTKEYNTLKALDLPCVNKMIALVNYQNRPVIVMEDFSGITLRSLLSKQKLSLQTFLNITIKIADAFSKIHDKNIMHKDINPDNILYNTNTGEIRIIDFGICAELSAERASAVNPNVLEGTLQYMSPEQTGRMNRSIDYRTDIYSLGITMYEMLADALPFGRGDAMDLVYAHIAKAIPPLTDTDPQIPVVLSDIVLKLTAKIPEDRYQSMAGLKYDLEQCLLRLDTANNTIHPFQLGQKDVYSKFRIPEHLYGRAHEIMTLMEEFDEVENGDCKLLLISGPSGIGKTALINEIHKPTIRKKGYFIAGKYDQFKRNVPFNAFALAFADLVQYLVSESEERLRKIKNDLHTNLGLNLNVLLELIPSFEHIVGKQNKAQELNTVETQNRFFFTIREFIRVFATEEHPLTMFLDDLQWADDSSLMLIKELMTQQIPYFFIIGTFRNNEVGAGHPLMLTIESLRKLRPIPEIELGPLDEKSVNQLVANTFQASEQETAELSAVVLKNTAGNPFYISELLKTAYGNGFVKFDHEDGKWHWDTKKIADLNISGNVVEVLTKRLRELPKDCLEQLEIAACIGNAFDLRTLALQSGKTASEVAAVIWPAIYHEIIIPLSDNYRLVVDDEDFGVFYKFHHDRVQHAAYSLIQDEKRKQIHLNIGRVLLKSIPKDHVNEKPITIVRHFNESLDLLTDPNERNEIANLNILAGKKAQSAVAYQAAFNYFKAGISLLPDNLWETHYQQAYELYKGLAQNAYQINDIDTAEKSIDLILLKAKTKLEKADILAVRLRQYNTIGKAEEAIHAGIEGLKLLGYRLSEKPGQLSVLKEVIVAKIKVGRRKPADLLNLPVMKDPEKRAAARLLTDIGPSAYILGNDNLYALTALKLVTLSLSHGNCPESSFAYLTFGAVLGEAFGNYKAADDFGKMALALNEQLNDIEYRCRAIAAYGVLTHHFNHHWETVEEWFKKGIEAGYLSGDLFFLAHCAGNCTIWNPKLYLANSIAQQQKYLKVIAATGYADALDTATMYLQLTKNRAGLTTDELTMDDEGFSEKECLQNMTKRKYFSGIGMYHIDKADIYMIHEEYEKAMASIKEAEKYLKSLVSNIHLERISAIAFFTYSGYINAGGTMTSHIKRGMKKCLSNLKKWSRYNPKNFEHIYLLMQAELANIKNDTFHASQFYQKAIIAASKNEWQADEAFANKLAAEFYYKNGVEKAAAGHLQEAFYLYNKWGATGNADFLAYKYPTLFKSAPATPATIRTSRTNRGTFKGNDNFQVLDVGTIVKSSQAISGEIELRSLLHKMMQIIITNAGAESGVLLLANESELYIQATAKGDEITTMQNTPARNSTRLPLTIINYVSNLSEPLVLFDAANQGKFTNDIYIAKHSTKSVLCSPIIFLNKLYGIIYLENNISAGAFTEDRLEILQLLSSQMAISINNATLYANLEAKVEERTVELKNEKQKSDELLHNILPEEVADELKNNGFATAKHYDAVTVLFTDFKDFSQATEKMSAQELLNQINTFYSEFDRIITKYGIEKIKTIGDSYMCVGGLPVPNKTHAIDAINAAIEMLHFTLAHKAERQKNDEMFMEIRIGVHTGPVVAGIVGVKKFAYDVWGSTVNLASRMESSGEAGRINISGSTYELIKDQFDCEYRGKVIAKNKGEVDMYFVNGKLLHNKTSEKSEQVKTTPSVLP